MPVPLALAAPAAAAALAYLNARTSFWYDCRVLRCAATGAARVLLRERRGRLNLFYLLEERARSPATAARDLVIFEGRRLSYADVYDRVLRYGAWLRTRFGVRPGDVVAMDMHNSDAFIVVWWALWSVGAAPALINYNLTGAPLAHCVAAAGARLCLVDADAALVDGVRAALGPGVALVELTPARHAEALATAPARAPDADRHADAGTAMAMLIYTSGTTGLPKPAVVSWSKCLIGSTMAAELSGRSAGDVMYTAMPLYHSSAAILAACASLWSGATLALGRRFSTKTFWPEVRASGATSLQYVGETLRYLLAAPPRPDVDGAHGVRLAFGNGLGPDIWDAFRRRFGVDTVVEFYAATEGPFATWNVSRNGLTAGAVGRSGWLLGAVQGLAVALVDVDWQRDAPRRDARSGFCSRVPPGQPGEMLVRLPADALESRFQGYFGDPAASAAKVLRDVFAPGDAWFRTGDVLRWDRDGRVFFTDRIGDTFRWKSENVSTVEVSHALGLHPAVREANVYGVELPHHDGRAGCVAICLDDDDDDGDDDGPGSRPRPHPGPGPDSDPRAPAPPHPPRPDTLRSLAAHVRAALPRYAQPLFLRVLPAVAAADSTTGTNKQQKHLLREAGVRPAPPGHMYWLQGDAYVPFGPDDWRALQAGRVKL